MGQPREHSFNGRHGTPRKQRGQTKYPKSRLKDWGGGLLDIRKQLVITQMTQTIIRKQDARLTKRLLMPAFQSNFLLRRSYTKTL